MRYTLENKIKIHNAPIPNPFRDCLLYYFFGYFGVNEHEIDMNGISFVIFVKLFKKFLEILHLVEGSLLFLYGSADCLASAVG